ncbi:MAG: glycosyltransferase family 39 protein [Bacteroidota bacterium]
MPTISVPALYRPYLWLLLTLKAALHLTAIINGYGIHRDEFLYLAMGDHPMLGYLECSPIIGWVAGLFTAIFGSSVWAAKLPVLLIGLGSVYLVLRLVRELGGGKNAQLVAGMAWVFSPAFLASNYLFQPVSFNQFCWLLIAFCWVRVVRLQRTKDWYFLGAAVGLGLLTKYSVSFYVLALGIGILLSSERKLLWHKNALRAAGLAFLIALPNIVWQLAHGLPVVNHMRLLSASQLVYVGPTDFLIPQLLFHFWGILLWLPGLWFLLRSEKLKPYRALAWAYLFTLILLLLTHGKSYYSIGAYSALIAAGGLFWEDKLAKRSLYLAPVFLLNFWIIPHGLPLLPVEQMQQYGVYMRDNWGMSAQLRWEDDSIRDLSQDYADMHGWEEMVAAVAEYYHQLSPAEQAETMLYAASYGQAGALTFYRKKYGLPQVHCFDSSFLLWTDPDIEFTTQIAVETEVIEGSNYFNKVELVAHPTTPYARQEHYIYFRSAPKMDLQPEWARILEEVSAVWMNEW